MLYLDRVLLTRRTVHRHFPTIKGWTTEKLRERVREERKANQLGRIEGPKGVGKERVEPPIQIPKEVHADPPLQKQPQSQKEQHQRILPENDEPSELEATFISLFHLYQSSTMKIF